MDVLAIIDKYGPATAIIVVVVFGLLPAVRDKVIPAWISLLTSESEFRRTIERERLASATLTNQHIGMLAEAMTQTNERIMLILQNQNKILDRQEDTLKALSDGMTAMRERVAARDAYEKGKKEHKPGDTGPFDKPSEP